MTENLGRAAGPPKQRPIDVSAYPLTVATASIPPNKRRRHLSRDEIEMKYPEYFPATEKYQTLYTPVDV